MSSAAKSGISKSLGVHVASGTSLDVEQFLLKLADSINTTLDLDTLLRTVAGLVKQVIPFEIFAILLVNEKARDLRMRFQIGHAPEVERLRIKIGNGVTGQAVERREPVVVADVTQFPDYINA